MIKVLLGGTAEAPRIEIKIDGRGGQATSTITPTAAISLCQKLQSLIVDALGRAIDEGVIEEAF